MSVTSQQKKCRSNGRTLFIIVVIGVLFHIVSMYSIFDIYFRSPLEHGMKTYRASQLVDDKDGSSKRLVFIVGDGLRADKFFEELPPPLRHDSDGGEAGEISKGSAGSYATPFMRSIIESGRASWGVSHTRVPTESRPGHVAMFAGFYEDMSAIFTGWKENLVEFDNVFNQSSYVLQIGSPDVVNMFHGDHIDTHHYPAEMEDFAAEDHTSVDKWVFDKLDELLDLSLAQSDEAIQLRNNLHGDRVIVFLHLLGIDTSGHTNRPNSKGYIDSIRFVDNGVRHVQERLESYFNHDGKTTYIFTADHGMTTRGSHGDGDPECTRTPLLVWGHGVRESEEGGQRIIHDGSMQSEEEWQYVQNRWNLDPRNRKDIHQADMTPLIASLLGINFPVNNVGRVPLSYLGGDDQHRTLALFANAKQILEQFKVKESAKRAKTSFFFRPFAPLASSDLLVHEIEQLIAEESFTVATQKCHQLIDLGLGGLNYYQTYDWTLLMTAITLGYVGWMTYILVFALSRYTRFGIEYLSKDITESSNGLSLYNMTTIVVFAAMAMYLHLQSAPPQYYAYVGFPIFFFNRIFEHLPLIVAFLRQNLTATYIFCAVYFVMALELFVIGYFRREIFSICFIALGIGPTVLDLSVDFQPRILWIVSCIFMSFFTLLPADYGTDIQLVRIGGVLLATVYLWFMLRSYRKYHSIELALFFLQWSLLLVATWLVHSTEESLARKQGLPQLNQTLSWSISILSLILPLISGETHYMIRMRSVAMAFAVPFIMLSISYEVLFFIGFSVVLELWLQREYSVRMQQVDSGVIRKEDFVTALFFIFFICVGFFGTGNLATIASFEISSVYRFITVFSPFTMTGLLIFKLGVPLMLLALTFTILMRITRTPAFATFFIMLALSDVMTLNFFFLVSDYGSWLEIGNAISRFGIGNGMIILILLFFSLSHIFASGVKEQHVQAATADDGSENKEDKKQR